jgi:prepilin peptidase CpaA
MGWFNPALALIACLAALLVAAGIEDVRGRTISNAKNIAIAALAPAWWWASGMMIWPDIAVQVAAALLVFALFIGVFAAGWMGGGDVKLIGALALWLPLGALASMLAVMSVIGGVLTLLMVADRILAKREQPVEVPYGVAIACAALLALREPILHSFQ